MHTREKDQHNNEKMIKNTSCIKDLSGILLTFTKKLNRLPVFFQACQTIFYSFMKHLKCQLLAFNI